MTRGLQKLLHPGMSAQVLERGYDRVGGVVIDVADANALAKTADVLEAYGLGSEWGDRVDVVRFPVPVCARLSQPPIEDRPWPTYPAGFLHPVGEALVPVWDLATTRYPAGSELWRIDAHGGQEQVAWYAGVARGWVGARGWRPPSRYVGPRAVWNGTEYAADVAGDEVELTTFTEPTDEGWGQHRAQTWSRRVDAADCEIYDLDYRARVDDVAVRILELADQTAWIQLVGDDPSQARKVGAHPIDVGVFENPELPLSALRDAELVANVRRT